MYDLMSNSTSPVINFEGINKNVTSVGFHEEGKWMYTGMEEGSVRIWDLRFDFFLYQNFFCIFIALFKIS